MSDISKDLRGLKADLLNVEKKITLLSIVKILAIYLKVREDFEILMLSIFQRIVSKNRMEYLVVTRDEMYLVLSFILYLVSCILYPASSPILSSVNLIDSCTVAIFGHTCVVLHMGCLQKNTSCKTESFWALHCSQANPTVWINYSSNSFKIRRICFANQLHIYQKCAYYLGFGF